MARHPHADLPVDTSVSVPRAVREAAARADAMYKPPEAPPGQPPAPVGQVEPAAGAPTNPTPGAPPSLEMPGAPATPPPGTPPAPGAPPTPPNGSGEPQDPPSAAPDSPDAVWERRYRGMKGRYDALQATTANQMNQLQGQIAALQQQVSARPQPTTPQSATPGAPSGLPPGFTEQDLETWGPDMIAIMDRIATARAQEATGVVTTRMQGVEQAAVGQAHDRMLSYLDTHLPSDNSADGWRDVNEDPAFAEWLDLRDALSGATRRSMLMAAFEAKDGPRVAAFFKSFISEAPPAPPAAQPGPAAPGTPPLQETPLQSNRIPLQSLAAPGRARPAAPVQPGSPAPKRIYKTSEIGAFFDAKARGKYAGADPAAVNAMEQDIFQAQGEGRVVTG